MQLLHFSYQDFGQFAAKRKVWGESHCRDVSMSNHISLPDTPTGTEIPPDNTDNGQKNTTTLILFSILHPGLMQEAVIKLLKDICLILPARYRSQCDALIGKFSKTVLDAILSFASPQVVCDIIHMCKEEEGPFVGQSAKIPLLQWRVQQKIIKISLNHICLHC